MSVCVVLGDSAAIATPTFSRPGVSYVVSGANRSTASVRSTGFADRNPGLAAVTLTLTLVPAMYGAFGGTLTSQSAVPPSSAEMSVNVAVPTCTVTDTPVSLPAPPAIMNPASCSRMLIVSSTVTGPRVSASVSFPCTTKRKVSLASFQLASPAAVTVTMHSPAAPASVSVPVFASTVHTRAGLAE